ncbi:hypothetical protein [Nonomuraea jiangxiensis]|uniref:Uncharacterized protein n=1 Tax=Nonomuraea jiangxiensis TaxID=633440 RepID=A0A1G9EFN1_9ACTN|nr:hypothetical protein [Nonomuraea jiangxiensis]SDK74970.1 hypothetical protein SAMN05421869_118145 [Nonomuraea jiangxiensis]
MTQEPAAEASSPVTAAAVLRFGAVLAASGPVLLTAFGIGRQSVGWFCSSPASAPYPPDGPYALVNLPAEVLFWAVLLLPVVVAGLLLLGSRRATLAAAAVIAAVLVYGLVTAYLVPGLDPCTGQERAAVPPWLLIVCYPMAVMALLAASRRPLTRSRHGIILWAGAAGAAAWAALFHRCAITYDERGLTFVFVTFPKSFLDDLSWWSGSADAIGLPVVLVALAATAQATVPVRRERSPATVAAAALLLFPLLDLAAYLTYDSDDYELPFIDSVRWPLLLAALLVASTTWRTWTRTPRTRITRLAQSLIRRLSERMTPGLAKNLVVAAVIAAAGIWLVATSFTPTR